MSSTRRVLPIALGPELVLLLSLAGPLSGQTVVTTVPGAAAGFAASVTLHGDHVLVGRSGAETRLPTYPQPGSLHAFARGSGTEWRVVYDVAPATGEVGDQFGAAVTIVGERMIVGSPASDATRGAAFLFRWLNGAWTETARLTPDAVSPGAGVGSAVAVAGDIVFLGAPGGIGDLPALGQPAPPQAGAVYVFTRDATGGWTEVARLGSPTGSTSDRFGATLLAAGNDLLVGAPSHDGNRGIVYLLRRAAGRWAVVDSLAPAGAARGDRFGAAMTLQGTTALIGAPGSVGGRGIVARFVSSGGQWEADGVLTPSDTAAAGFGTSVGASPSHVIVGAPLSFAGTGASYVFTGASQSSSQALSTDAFGAGALFGTSVAIAADLAVVGAGFADLRLGAAVVFERSATGEWTEAAALRDPTRNEFAAITGDTIPCSGGAASGFACSQVDLVAFVPLAELGAGPASIANDIWGWTDSLTGREYALLGKSNGTSFVDITDATRPVYLGELPLTEGAQENLWRDIKTYADHAFIVADGAGAHGMQIFDLTQLRDIAVTPVQFGETAHYDGVFSAHNIVINERTGFAFAVGSSGGGETCGGGLHMIDIRNPTAPTFAGCYSDRATGGFGGAGYTHDAQCVVYHGPDGQFAGREVCFHASINALGISDITDKANPVSIASADYPGVVAAHQGWLSDDHRFFFMGDELDEESQTVANTRTLIWDVAQLDDPILLAEYFADTKAIDHNQYVRGRFLYQSNLMSGLRILDISDAEHPVEVGFFDTVPYDDDLTAFGGSWSNYPFFESGIIAVSSWNEGLFLVKKRPQVLIP